MTTTNPGCYIARTIREDLARLENMEKYLDRIEYDRRLATIQVRESDHRSMCQRCRQNERVS